MKKRQPTALCLGLLTMSSIATAQTVTFELIPGARSADDMSPDGRYVVGFLQGGGTYIWDRQLDTMTPLPPEGNYAVGVSDDGEFVISNIDSAGTEVAGRWEPVHEHVESLGSLGSCGTASSAYEISADGSVVTGLAWVGGCDAHGMRWTSATGMLALESLANGTNRASVITADGTLIGGFAQGSFSRTPAIWDDTLAGQLLDPPTGDVIGEVHGLRDDGSVLLGEWSGDAFKWTIGGAFEILGAGQLISGWIGIPMDIADDDTIVGFDVLLTARRAWIQPGGVGDLVLLQQYIEDNGGTVPAGFNLEVCQAITTDGSVIIGHGFTGAWIVTIGPGPCPADITGPTPGESDGNVDALDFLLMIAQWGTPCVGSCESDITGPTPNVPDGNVDSLDFLLLIAQWGSPGNCPTP